MDVEFVNAPVDDDDDEGSNSDDDQQHAKQTDPANDTNENIV